MQSAGKIGAARQIDKGEKMGGKKRLEHDLSKRIRASLTRPRRTAADQQDTRRHEGGKEERAHYLPLRG